MIPTIDPGIPAFRGVLVAALMLLVGAPPTLRFVVFPELERRGLDTSRAHYAALAFVEVTLVGAILAGTALTVANAPTVDVGSYVTWTGSTSAGQAWVAFVAAAFVTGALTAGRHALPDRVSRRLWLGTVFVGGLVMLAAFCWTRYSTAVGSPAVAILAKFGHMTGAALWVGGLAVLAVLPAFVSRESDTDTARFVLAATRRFSMIAVTGVTVAFATGVVIAAWHVPTLTALVTTPYGILLSLKAGLVSAAAVIGGFNRFVLHEQIAYSVRESNETALPGMLTVVGPRIAATDAVSTFARSIRLELAVLVLSIGLSVALTTAVTPSYELLVPAVTASNGILGVVALVGFAKLLKLGAVGIALAGSLALGYELGKFGAGQ